MVLFNEGFLEDFFLEFKAKVIAFLSEDGGQTRISAVEDCDLPPVLVTQLLEDLGPVRPTSIGLGLQSSHSVFVVLQKAIILHVPCLDKCKTHLN